MTTSMPKVVEVDTREVSSVDSKAVSAKEILTLIAKQMNTASQISKKELDIVQKVSLYGLFTQATKGDSPSKSPYAVWDFEGGIKFQAWQASKGKTTKECIAEYKKIALSLFPTLDI